MATLVPTDEMPAGAPTDEMPAAAQSTASSGVLTDDGTVWPEDKPATPSPQQSGGFQWSPMSVPGIASRLGNALMGAASLPGDVATGKIDMNDPMQARSNVGRVAQAASLASPMGPEAIGSRLIAPASEDLYKAGSEGFNAWNKSGVEINPSGVANAATQIKQGLINNDFLIPESAPRTHALLDQLATPPTGALPMRAADLDAARQKLVELGQSPGDEGMAARTAKRGLLDYMQNVAPQDIVAGASAYPEARTKLSDAIGNWAAGSRTGALEGIDENAELRAAAANSGKNIGNATRQRVASFVQNPPANPAGSSMAVKAGFNPDEIEALKGVVQGGPGANAARGVANLLGGGGGIGRMMTTAAGAGLGHMTGVGPEVGGLVGFEAGHAAKGLENAAVQRSLRQVTGDVAQRSPLFQSGQGPQAPVFPTARNALVRALMTQQQPPSQ